MEEFGLGVRGEVDVGDTGEVKEVWGGRGESEYCGEIWYLIFRVVSI